MHILRRLPPPFYIGLFPVVILLGLWADSISYGTEWSYGRGWDQTRVVEAHRSRISFKYIVATEKRPGRLAAYLPRGPLGITGPFGAVRRSPIQTSSGVDAGDWFPSPVSYVSDNHPSGDFHFEAHFVELPIWLLLLAWLPPWLGLAWWQARRLHPESPGPAI